MTSLIHEAKIAKQILKENGVRALFKKYGWKLAVIVLCYYIVRDLTLYVAIPAVASTLF